tara:strand:+ start:175 stop:543 length:369 start_codon:yes stop_codon:yes gene_type:complete
MPETLNTTLTLSSTDATSDTLNMTVTDSLSVGAPLQSVARVSVLHTGATELLNVTDNTADTYVYLKNMDSTNYVVLQTSAGTAYGILHPSEISFFAVQGERGLKVLANSATCIVEYGYWTKS